MNKETASCKVVADSNDYISNWICKGLNIDKQWLGEHFTIGFVIADKLVGGLIYHDLRPRQDVWWTLYTTNKRWCSKKVLKFIFSLAFSSAFSFISDAIILLLITCKNVKCKV